MSEQVASLFAKIGADTTDLTRGLNDAKSQLSGVEKSFGGLQNAVGGALKVAAGVGVVAVGALATGIGMAVKRTADMEQGIANIAATMGLTKDETGKLKDVIMDLGLDPKLKVTAVEAANAIDMLGKNGLSLEEIMGGAARSTVLLQNSVGGDFATSADIATDVMSLFNIKAEDMTAAVNGIVGVTKSSKFDINDYGLAIAQAGGVASAVGVNFDDFNATIAAISPSFGGGSDAGTSFKVFLQRLIPTTENAKRTMLELGLSTGDDVATAFYTADGAMRPMEEIAQNLHTAFAGLSDAQRNQAASTLFGTDAMRAALALADAGGQTITDLKDKIGDTSAEEAAATRMNTLSGAWEIFLGIVETLALGIGDKFLPIARKLVDWVSELAGKYGPMLIDWAEMAGNAINIFFDGIDKGYPFLVSLNNAVREILPPDLFAKWMEFINIANDVWLLLKNLFVDVTNFETSNPLVLWLIGVTDGIREAIQWITGIVTQFVSWQDVLMVLGGIILSIVIPAIGGFLAAALPIIALFAALVAHTAFVRNAWENDWLGIRTAILFAWDIISGVFNSVMLKVGWIVDGFKTQWAILADTNASLGEKLALIWQMILDVAFTVWQGIVTAVTILFAPFVAKLKEWGVAAWEWLAMAIPLAIDKIAEWGAGLLKWVGANAPKWIDALTKWAVAAWEWIVKATTEAVQKLGEWGSALWGWLATNAPKWVDQLSKWATAAWEWIVQVIPVVLQKLGEWGSAMLTWLAGKLPDFINMLLGWGTEFYKWITNIIPTAINALADFIHGLRDKGDSEGTPAFIKLVSEWATKFWRWITDELIPAVGPAFGQFIAAMLNYGKELYLAIGHLATELGLLLWEWIVAVTPIAVQKLGEWGKALWGWITDNMPEWMRKLGVWATAAWEWIADAIPPALIALRGWGQALWGWIVQNAPEWGRQLGVWGKAAWQWIVDMTPIALQKLGEFGQQLLSWIGEKAREWVDKFTDAGRDAITGLWEGIQRGWQWMTQPLMNLWNSLPEGLRKMIDSRSPSRVFALIGETIPSGLLAGINSGIPSVLGAVSSLASQVQSRVDAMVRGVQDSVGSINNSLNSIGTGNGNTGTGTAPGTPTGVGNNNSTGVPFVPTGTANQNASTAYGGYQLNTATLMVSGQSFYDKFNNMITANIKGFGSELHTFVSDIAAEFTSQGQTPTGTAADALNLLQGGAVTESKVDDVLSAIQDLLRALAEKGLGNQFMIQQQPDESLAAKEELIQLISYLNALYA